MIRFAAALWVVVAVFFVLHCGSRNVLNLSGAPTSGPKLLHVTNGQAVGFYTTAGKYGFGTQANSIYGFGTTLGNAQPLVQNTLNGFFYMGTGQCTNCNSVIYFNGLLGGFLSGSLVKSQMALVIPGESLGVAYSSFTNRLYVTDPINAEVIFLNASGPNYAMGKNPDDSTFDVPTGLLPAYDAVSGSTVAISDTAVGSLFFLNGQNGNLITAGNNQGYLPLVSASTACDAATLVNEVAAGPTGMIYVLCGQSVIYISIRATPTYSLGTLTNSTIAVPSNIPIDLVYDSVDAALIVGGGTTLTSFNGITGAANKSLDLSVYGCTSGISIGGLAFSPDKQLIFVSDTKNSSIYVLNSSDLTLSTGACATSVFSTSTDVPSPTRLGYF
jgi:hypothetical protein